MRTLIMICIFALSLPAICTDWAEGLEVATVDQQGNIEMTLDKETLRYLLTERLAASGNYALPITLTEIEVVHSGKFFYLNGKGTKGDDRCINANVTLDAVAGRGNDSLVITQWVEVCVGTTCPECVVRKNDAGRIVECYCLPAGECVKTVIPIIIPLLTN